MYMEDRLNAQIALLESLIQQQPDPLSPGASGVERFEKDRLAWIGRLETAMEAQSVSSAPERIGDLFDQLPAQSDIQVPSERTKPFRRTSPLSGPSNGAVGQTRGCPRSQAERVWMRRPIRP
jgi:hypothetical protein